MKKIYSVIFLILLFPSFVVAEFAILKIEERVKQNNLIVIGKLQDVSETETENLRISKGTLVIEKVIFGNFKTSEGQNLKTGGKIQVEWANSKVIACQFGFTENEEEIWFLNVDERGYIEPLSPSTTASLSELAEAKKYLKKLEREPQLVKTVKVKSNSDQNLLTEVPVNKKPQISFGIYSLERKANYSLISALLIILSSVSLYYLLYRSRFKIR